MNTTTCIVKVIRYCWLIKLATFEISLNIYELDPARFHSASRLTWQADVKKTKAKLDLLTDIDMLIVVVK